MWYTNTVTHLLTKKSNIMQNRASNIKKIIGVYNLKIMATEAYINLYTDYKKSSSDRLEKREKETPSDERIPQELYNDHSDWCEKIEVLRAEQKAYKEFNEHLESLLK